MRFGVNGLSKARLAIAWAAIGVAALLIGLVSDSINLFNLRKSNVSELIFDNNIGFQGHFRIFTPIDDNASDTIVALPFSLHIINPSAKPVILRSVETRWPFIPPMDATGQLVQVGVGSVVEVYPDQASLIAMSRASSKEEEGLLRAGRQRVLPIALEPGFDGTVIVSLRFVIKIRDGDEVRLAHFRDESDLRKVLSVIFLLSPPADLAKAEEETAIYCFPSDAFVELIGTTGRTGFRKISVMMMPPRCSLEKFDQAGSLAPDEAYGFNIPARNPPPLIEQG